MAFPVLVLWAFLSIFGGSSAFDVTGGSPTAVGPPPSPTDVTGGSPTVVPHKDVTISNGSPKPAGVPTVHSADVTGGSPTVR